MSEEVQKIVDSVRTGNNIEAQKNFNDTMSNKVAASLDDAKTEVAKSMFTGQQGVQPPEADPFTGENIEQPAEETPAEEVPSNDQDAQ